MAPSLILIPILFITQIELLIFYISYSCIPYPISIPLWEASFLISFVFSFLLRTNTLLSSARSPLDLLLLLFLLWSSRSYFHQVSLYFFLSWLIASPRIRDRCMLTLLLIFTKSSSYNRGCSFLFQPAGQPATRLASQPACLPASHLASQRGLRDDLLASCLAGWLWSVIWIWGALCATHGATRSPTI